MSDQNDEILTISLDRVSKPVLIDGKRYEVREMSGRERDRWLNQLSVLMKTGPDGKPAGLKSYDGVQAGLISACLYDEQGNQVTQNVIADWPARAQSAVFDLCQKINGLGDEKNQEDVKND